MAEKTSGHSSREWTDEDVATLRELANGHTPAAVMSIKLGRTEDAIRAKAKAEGISLAPPNRSPYGTFS
jgi:hypothetical protein